MFDHMATTKSTDFLARGKILSITGKTVVFRPSNTNYELHIGVAGNEPPTVSDQPIHATIRVRARKVWTVPSGGNFIAPIFGQPKIIQGRVKWLDDRTLVVHAGTDFVVEMPASDQAVDLANGVIGVGSLVNVTAMPGATFELRAPVAV